MADCRHWDGVGYATLFRSSSMLSQPKRRIRYRRQRLHRHSAQRLDHQTVVRPPAHPLVLDDRIAIVRPGALARYAAALSRARSQVYPSPAAEPDPDGSTTVYFGPQQPQGVKRGNWFKRCLIRVGSRFFASTVHFESFFTKEWRLSEIELVRS